MRVIFFAKPSQIFSGSVLRITLFFCLLVTVIVSAFLGVMYRQLVSEQEQQVAQHLEAETIRYQNLASRLSRRGFARHVIAADNQMIFVSWFNGAHFVGALSFIPEDMPKLPNTRDFPVLAGGSHKLYMLKGGVTMTALGPVLVATRTDHLLTLFDDFIGAAVTAITLTISLTLTLGLLFSKAILSRIEHYRELAGKIEQGDYGTRFPAQGRLDELDMVTQQFNRVLDTLENNLASVRGVTDNIAHDLRTPLSHLRIGLEELQHKPCEQVPEACALLTEELDHCLATFDAMLSLTRIEGGQRELDREEVSLHQICGDLLEMAEALAEAQQQELKLELGEDYKVIGDKHLLFQALFNLVDNAITYSGKGAVICIVQQGQLISISDNGPGIPEVYKEKVFERLVRLDPSRQLKGTGLGLSMVKAILSRHQASIELANLNPGLQVTINFG